MSFRPTPGSHGSPGPDRAGRVRERDRSRLAGVHRRRRRCRLPRLPLPGRGAAAGASGHRRFETIRLPADRAGRHGDRHRLPGHWPLPSTTYVYLVRAHDAAGNVSSRSRRVRATTREQPTGTSALAQLAASLAPGQWATLETIDIDPDAHQHRRLEQHDLRVRRRDEVGPGFAPDALPGLRPRRPRHARPEQHVSLRGLLRRHEHLERPADAAVGHHQLGHRPIHRRSRLRQDGDQSPGPPPLSQSVQQQEDPRLRPRYGRAGACCPIRPNTGSSCCDAIEYVPGAGRPRVVAGHGRRSSSSTNRASSGPAGNGGVSLASTWMFAEHNPVHGVTILGSSTGALFELSGSGDLAPLQDIPVTIYDGSAWNGVVTVDPVSGDYLVLTPPSRQLHVYDVVTDTWRPSPNAPPGAGHERRPRHSDSRLRRESPSPIATTAAAAASGSTSTPPAKTARCAAALRIL